MQEIPLVSIIVNNYNYARFLSESIDSALNQSYSNTEVIVVDDGSLDKSREVIEKYRSLITPVFKENAGQASAINAGYRASSGEVICLLDSDDFWLPEKVHHVVQAFRNRPEASVVYHKVQNIDVERQPIDRPWPHILVKGNIADKVSKTGGWWPFSPSTGLSFSKRFLEEVMDIPEKDYRICADTYLADLAPFFGDVVGINQPLSYMRIHNDNNWSYPEQAGKREVEYHKIRIGHLNQVLARFNFSYKIDLSSNLAYRETLFRLGKENKVRELILLTLMNPFDWRPHSRIKAAVNILLRNRNSGQF